MRYYPTQAQAAYDYAQNFYNRQQGLWKSRTISANDLENARSSRDQAQATQKSAQDKLRQYRSGNREQDIAQAKASLEQAQAQLAQAELNLQDSTLVAPSDGTLLTRAVEPGTVLNEGGTVFTVSLTRPVWVRAYIDERNLDQAQPGRKVLLYTDGRPDKPYHGQIGFVSPTAEQKHIKRAAMLFLYDLNQKKRRWKEISLFVWLRLLCIMY